MKQSFKPSSRARGFHRALAVILVLALCGGLWLGHLVSRRSPAPAAVPDPEVAAASRDRSYRDGEEVFRRFDAWVQDYRTRAAATAPDRGVELARRRQTALEDLAASDPERARQLTLPVELRRSLPAAVQDLLDGDAALQQLEMTAAGFSFDRGKLSIRRCRGYDAVSLEGAELPEDEPGTPWLPALYVNVLIPPGHRLLRVDATLRRESPAARGLEVYPAQPPTPTCREPEAFVEPKPAAYAATSKTPLVETGAVHRVRGMRYVSLRLNPVRLVPATGELYLAEAFDVRVATCPETTPSSSLTLPPAAAPESFKRLVRRLVVNPEALETAAYREPAGNTETTTASPTADCRYLIVTDETLSTAFQALADHRGVYNGYSTEIKTVTDIAGAYAGSDTQEKIRNCIIDYVNNKNTLYVVLGGDNAIVPDRNCYVSCGSYTENQMPTDLYYAGLDGNWDEDGDGIYGEADTSAGDEGDLDADVYVGRIPVRTATQATNYINKVVEYETNPPLEIAKKFMMTGHKLWDRYSGDDRPTDQVPDGHSQFRQHSPVSDAEMWMRRTYRDYVQAHGWQTATTALLFDTVTSWDSSSAGDYAASGSHMRNKFNQGWNFVINDTHGGDSVLAADGDWFDTAKADALTGLTAVFYTGACLSGKFDKAEPSLSEAMIRSADGGALLYVGCSRYNWGSPDSPPASNYSDGGTGADYMHEFLRLVFEDKITNVGQAFFDHKAAFASSSGYNNSKRWDQFGLNLQGDPALEMIISDGANNPPIAHGQSLTMANHRPRDIALSAVDFDGDPLTYHIQSQPTHGSVSLSGTTATYQPEPGYVGNDSFSFVANDGSDDSNPATVGITVTANHAPFTFGTEGPIWVQSTAATQLELTWYAGDEDNDPLTWTIVTPPSNGTLTPTIEAGVFLYDPVDGYRGPDSFSFKVSDGLEDSNISTIELTVGNNVPWAYGSKQTVDEDQTLEFLLEAYESDPDTLSFIVVSGPSHGALNLGAGAGGSGGDGSGPGGRQSLPCTYTPDPDWHGTDTFDFKVNDGVSDSRLATVTITVNPVNDVPAISDIADCNIDRDSSTGPIAFTVGDVETAAPDLILSTASSNTTLVPQANIVLGGSGAERSVTVTPAAGQTGTATLTIIVSDGELSAQDSFILTVSETSNDPPYVGSIWADPEEITLPDNTVTVSCVASDPDGDALSYSWSKDSGPAAVSFATPNADSSQVSFDTAGVYVLKVTVSDETLTDTATVQVLVHPAPNTPPVAAAQALQTDEDTPVETSLSATDADGDSLTYAVVGLPDHGAIVTDGAFVRYTPDANWHGTDSFSFTANDGEADSHTATVTITVISRNDAPVANADSYSTDEDTGITVNAPGVLGNDSDIDGDTLTPGVSSPPAHGDVQLNSDGSFEYLPAPDYHGADSFSYVVSDGNGGSATATVSIAVADANDAPNADAGADQTVADSDGDGVESVTLDGSGSSDADGNIVSYVWTQGATQIATGQNPAVNLSTGTHSITLTVTDDDGASAVDTVTVAVNQASTLKLEAGSASIGGSWSTVTLQNSYSSPVVVCAVNYRNNSVPVCVRVRNAGAGSFEARLQNPSGAAVNAETVYYVVMDEGVGALPDGRKIEAARVLSDGTSENKNWSKDRMEAYSYRHSYSSPVVLGQVMTANDADWSTFWCSNGNQNTPPTASACYLGKQVAEDTDAMRADETLGVIVVEAGSGTIAGLAYRAALGGDSIQGAGDSPAYTYALSGFSAAPAVGIATQAAMDGGNGGWAVLHGAAPLQAGSIGLAIDEDQIGDSERNHTTEQVGVLVFQTAFAWDDGQVNQPPVADAGADQTVADSDGDGVESVTLDGSGSSDADGNIVSYVWTQGATQIATGQNPAVNLSTGTHSITLTVTDDDGASAVDTVTVAVNQASTLKLEAGSASIGGSWSTVTLQNSYSSPVVVCAVNYRNNSVPVCVRVRNAGAGSFEARLQNPSGAAVNAETVYYVVMDEGVGALPDGRKIEAARVLSDGTSENKNWSKDRMEAYSYRHSYSSPVVLGQVMTANDADWSTFWCSNGNQNTPPTANACYVGKQVAEDADVTRANETLGIIVIESGSGTIDGVPYQAALGGNSIRGIDDSPAYTYTLSGFSATPTVGIIAQATMNGSNGGWSVLYGSSPLIASAIGLAVDEDQIGDSERVHVEEQVGFLVFQSAVAIGGSDDGAFLETNGQVVIEAEHAHAAGAGSTGDSWESITTLADSSGGEALLAGPNDGDNMQDSIKGPRLDYKVTFKSAGVYYVWVRIWGSSNKDDSVHAGLDGVPASYGRYGITDSSKQWHWEQLAAGQRVTVQVDAPGAHTLNIWMREDGTAIDKLLLTTDSAYTPSGPGPAESPRDGG